MTRRDEPTYYPDVVVTGLSQVTRLESPIHYRRSYTAVAHFQLPPDRVVATGVEFTLESAAIGDARIRARILGDLDYPLVPAIRALREYVIEADQSGGLP